MKNKKIVLFQPGPLHLFWVSGIYYYYLINEKYSVILLVDKTYKSSADFNKFINSNSIYKLIFYDVGVLLLKQYNYCKLIKELLSKYKIKFALLHSNSYIENLYIKKFVSKIIIYQNARVPLNLELDLKIRRAVEFLNSKDNFFQKFPIDFNLIKYLIVYKIIPFLVSGRTFTPSINVYSDSHIRDACVKNFDTLMVYNNNDKSTFQYLGFTRIRKITHPIVKYGEIVANQIYLPGFYHKETILIAPTYGFCSYIIFKGKAIEEVIGEISKCWIDAIKELSNKYPSYAVVIKLHPMSHKELVWDKVLYNIKSAVQSVIILDSSLSVEPFAYYAKVIVGDVTSTLWWASFFGNKTIISLDIFGYYGGDEFKNYSENITYIDNISKINYITNNHL